jgi:glycosyltransferase involved in cell wall biosynthesis
MKKKLLFIIPNLNSGGAEKALLSLLQTLDFEKYEVDLLLFKKEGIFLNQLPKEVHLLPEPQNYGYFDMPLVQAVTQLISKLKFKVLFYRLAAIYIFKTEKTPTVREQKVWSFMKNALHNLDKEYDVAIGYLQKTANYFCIDKVKATKKIGFVHNDYRMLQLDKTIDEPYFRKFNSIVTISEVCESILKEEFPQFANKIGLMYNISSPKSIWKMAEAKVDIDASVPTIVTVGRLNDQKGLDIAIDACKILVDKGYQLKWYIIGEGNLRYNLEQQIAENNLQSHFILLGLKENPYPYLQQATIYAQPSRFEGKSIAIDEAKILQKPILVTNFPSAKDQIEHLVSGYVVEINAKAIAGGLEELLKNKSLRDQLTTNLQGENNGTEHEIEKLYQLL